jgi:hypothetical protein
LEEQPAIAVCAELDHYEHILVSMSSVFRERAPRGAGMRSLKNIDMVFEANRN